MRLLITTVLDWFIPATLKERSQSEELDRARTLISVLLVVLASTLIHRLCLPFSDFLQFYINRIMLLNLNLTFLSITLALLLFRYSGNFIISGNLFALTTYLATLVTAFTVPADIVAPAIILMLATPLLVAQIANYLSGIIWVIIIALTPFVINQLGFHAFEIIWLTSWLIVIAGLFFSSYIAHQYRVNMASRLKNERAQFEFAASHDPLTRLANRISFSQKFLECLDNCRSRQASAVFVYIDLNHFKPVNDNHGHPVGDQVLITVGKRITQLVRRADTVARLGGDEFAILFEHCNLGEVEPLIERIKMEIGKPINIEGQEISITCSIGIVSCPEDGLDPVELYSRADQRMYEAKGTAATRPYNR